MFLPFQNGNDSKCPHVQNMGKFMSNYFLSFILLPKKQTYLRVNIKKRISRPANA